MEQRNNLIGYYWDGTHSFDILQKENGQTKLVKERKKKFQDLDAQVKEVRKMQKEIYGR